MTVANQRLQQLVRTAAVLDLLVTWPLLTPVSAKAYLHIAYALDRTLPGGTGMLPDIPALGWLFINLTGALAVLWGMARLLWPSRQLGSADALARLWVAALIAGYITAGGLPPIFWAFVGTELLGTAIQIPVVKARSAGRLPQ